MYYEMRKCKRRSVPIQVDLIADNADKHAMLRCTTNNISMSGMFIRTGNIDFIQYKKLKLIIPPQLNIIDTNHSMDAAITRHSDTGIGVMIYNESIKTHRLIRALCDAYDLGMPGNPH